MWTPRNNHELLADKIVPYFTEQFGIRLLCSVSIMRKLGRCTRGLWSETGARFLSCAYIWGHFGRGAWRWRWRRRRQHESACGVEEEKADLRSSAITQQELRAGEQTGAGKENAACEGARTPASTSRCVVSEPSCALENQTAGAWLRSP